MASATPDRLGRRSAIYVVRRGRLPFVHNHRRVQLLAKWVGCATGEVPFMRASSSWAAVERTRRLVPVQRRLDRSAASWGRILVAAL